jgi:hypothetical protein
VTAEQRVQLWIAWWYAHFTPAELAAHQRVVDDHRRARRP